MDIVLQMGKDYWGILFVVVLPFLLPNAWLRKIGYRVGRILSRVLRQKTGGEAAERWLQGTVTALVEGLMTGLDKDDQVPA